MSSTALERLPWRASCSGFSSFFAAARERYHGMLLRRSGRAAPWFTEPVFQQFRFCNVFREDDRTTVWFAEQVRNGLSNHPTRVLLATMIFRWFNRIETGQLILPMLRHGEWNEAFARQQLAGVHPVVTGAYIIKTPAGMNKLDGIIWCINEFVRAGLHDDIGHNMGAHTLQGVHEGLMEAPYLGPFMAYEIVTDLTHTRVLESAPDLFTWCSLGPGATRGLGWVLHGDPGHYDRHRDQARMLDECRVLLAEAHLEQNWPRVWPQWQMREVEHWLCEYDKLQRGVRGEKLKRRYSPAM